MTNPRRSTFHPTPSTSSCRRQNVLQRSRALERGIELPSSRQRTSPEPCLCLGTDTLVVCRSGETPQSPHAPQGSARGVPAKTLAVDAASSDACIFLRAFGDAGRPCGDETNVVSGVWPHGLLSDRRDGRRVDWVDWVDRCLALTHSPILAASPASSSMTVPPCPLLTTHALSRCMHDCSRTSHTRNERTKRSSLPLLRHRRPPKCMDLDKQIIQACYSVFAQHGCFSI